MKKFKKLLAGLLAGAMMLGSMSATAFAAEETNTPKMTAATIDTSLKGSLTIHKYEYNGNRRYKREQEKHLMRAMCHPMQNLLKVQDLLFIK